MSSHPAPHAFAYSLSLTLSMSAFYHDAPDVALQAVLLLIVTTWHHRTRRGQSKQVHQDE